MRFPLSPSLCFIKILRQTLRDVRFGALWWYCSCSAIQARMELALRQSVISHIENMKTARKSLPKWPFPRPNQTQTHILLCGITFHKDTVPLYVNIDFQFKRFHQYFLRRYSDVNYIYAYICMYTER